LGITIQQKLIYNNFQGTGSNSSPTLSSRYREQGRLEEGDFLLQEVKFTYYYRFANLGKMFINIKTTIFTR
jgi:hypothetical protein